MDENKIYQELALTWRHFASWREKVFAGYLGVLAALAVGFIRSPSPVLRLVIFAAEILLSLVFWLLDVRNSQLINACQLAAARLEGSTDGSAALNMTRFRGSKWWASYAFAIDFLVTGVIGASAGGLYIYYFKLPGGAIGQVVPVICLVTFLGFFAVFRRTRNMEWLTQKTNSKAKKNP